MLKPHLSRTVLFTMFALGAGSGWSQARIESFSPSGYAKDVRQVAARFSEAMVALGEPEGLYPFAVDCEVPGNGRWIDERNWVYDFDYDVPGALNCRFSLRAVRTLRGETVQAPVDYAFHTGGPAVIAWEPDWGPIDERQVFLLVLDAVADPDSIDRHVRCRIAGSGPDHPVDALQEAERARILDALAASDADSFQPRIGTLVEAASRLMPAGPEHETHARALERIAMVRCQDPLPAGSDVELVWGHGVAGLNGMATTQEHVLPFSVRPPFEAHPYCASRFDDHCVGGIDVHFTASVDRELAYRVQLVDVNGDVVPPKSGDTPEVNRLRFPGAFRDQTSYRVEIVAPITDVDGRALANATSFPRTIEVGRLPPGASFGTRLGVVQDSDRPVAGVLLRHIGEPLAGRLHTVTDDADIVTWMRRIESVRDTEIDLWDAVAAERSVFDSVRSGTPITLSPEIQAETYQDAGVPLPGRGFHVVELELPAAGSLPRRYVAGMRIVTDLAIHVHRGEQSSLVWVTGLSDGLPVEDADIAISDACTGGVLARATTDAQGIARVGPLTWRGSCAEFRYLVSARKDGDLAVWTSGVRWELEPGPGFVAHEILDRTLYQPGETVSAKLIVRRATADGLALPGERARKVKVTIKHYGTGESQETTVDIADNGSAVASFDLPANAKLGYYDIDLEINGRRVWTRGSFRVERFRIGGMRATIEGPPGPLVSNGSLPVTLSVQHLAGGGAPSLPVSVRTTVRPWLYAWEYRQPSEPRTTSLTLDSNGKAQLAIPLPTLERSGALDVEMDYQDANGQLKTESKRFELWPAAIALGVWDGWELEGGDPDMARKQLRVRARKLDDTPATGVPINANIHAPRHFANRRLPGGFRGRVRAAASPLLGTCSGRTDAHGFLACDAPAGAPTKVFVEATAQDGQGNTAHAVGRVHFNKRTHPWVKVAGDRQYAIGESVAIAMDLPFAESTVLVAVHREGVMDAFVERVAGPEAVIDIPVRRNYAPNVKVSLLAIQPGKRPTQVPHPGTPQPGKPDFGTVDANRPDYRLDTVDIRVGHDDHALSVNVEPDRDIYRVRERAAVRVSVTGPDGLPRANAEVALAAVNEGLLDLWPNETWNILGVMMAERYSRVYSSTSIMPRPAKRTIMRSPKFDPVEEVIVTGSYERSPGFGLPSRDEDPAIRENFDALLLWHRRLAMDENGVADVEIPLNDLLTSFRIVAVATAGADLFGTGEATIRTTQDLILHAGLPEVVRSGDRFDAVFNLRNASSARRRASVVAEVDGMKLRRKRLTLRPGESRQVSWPVTVPTGVEQLHWAVTAKGGSAGDRLAVQQRVESAVPVRVLQATLTQLAKPRELPVKTPARADPDRGGVRVSLRSSLADGLDTVRAAMSRYRYDCLEQNISVAVVLDDDERWSAVMDKARDSLDPDGLLRFFPSDRLKGSPVLTAYVLTVADASGKTVPKDLKDAMIEGLEDYLAGRVVRKPLLRVADPQFRRLSALAALARHGALREDALAGMHVNLETLPTSALLDWLDVLTRVDPDSEQIGAAKATLRTRLNLQGTTMGFSTEHRDRLWWLMVSTDANAARSVLALLDDPDWQTDLPRMMRGLFGRQLRGRWETTVANAWGALAANAFGRAFEADPITGTSAVELGKVQHRAHWPDADAATDAPPGPIDLPWSAAETLSLAHSGTGAPWSLIELRAAVPSTDPVQRGYRVVRRTEGVERKNAREWSRGDIARIVLDIDASAEMTWVVVEDPLPPGAVVLGSGLGDDSSILGQTHVPGNRWPIFVERDFDSYRAYYHHVPKGRTTLRYNVRYNTAGRFQLPPTRVEAMYAPETHGELPIDPIAIK